MAAGLLLAALALAACSNTTYRTYDDPERDQNPLLGREVTYWLNPIIYSARPECAVVLTPKDKPSPDVIRLVGPALARYLGERLPRVIDPLERKRLEKTHGIDPHDKSGRLRFAKATGCNAYLLWRVVSAEDSYFLVWSQRRLRVEAALYRVGDDRLFWQAAHTGRRSDGTLPLSPLSLPFAVFEATNFTADNDVLPSMIDDVVRRLIITLPDLR
ncbi:MAG: hypothetical protein OEO83_12585 [Alphaproteobacteria bacterium]|nr:hypothetical protein [Alphaproteobacteria bacterium]